MAIDYSRTASDYDAVRGSAAVDRSYWLPALVEVGGLWRGQRVLDLGAGTGRFAALLAESMQVVAADRSEPMLARARTKAGFAVVRADAHALPFRADAFDAAVLVMVVHQLSDLGRALREVARVSRRAVVATSDLAKRRLGILEEAFPSLLAIDRARFPPIPGLVKALRAAGFPQVSVEERSVRRSWPVPEQLDRVSRRYISTFDLLPAGEFERGVAFLERELPRRFGATYEAEDAFTFLRASRGP